MQSTEKLAQIGLTRQELVWLWLRRNGIKYSDIAGSLDVAVNTVKAWLESDRIPQWRHEMLVKYGIPVEILPDPVNIAPGPKRKA